MSSHITSDTTLQEYLNRDIWCPDEFKIILDHDNSKVNQVKRFETPLMRVLKNDQCSEELILHLIQHGANVHRKDKRGFSPLMVSLWHSRDEAVTRLLLAKGASAKTLSKSGESPLCIALQRGTTANIVRILLDSGCPLDKCSKHSFSLRCATSFPFTGTKEDILKVLIEKGANRNIVDRRGESLLCRAHRLGAEAHHVKAMLEAGFPLGNCRRHPPLLCLLGDIHGRPFKGDVLKVLLDAGAGDFIVPFMLLHNVLRNAYFNNIAIKLLLSLPQYINGFDNVLNISPLEFALARPHFPISTLKILIDKGADLNHLNIRGESFLHIAVIVPCRLSIINVLLQRGCPVNRRDILDCTPLIAAVKKQRNPIVLQTLLNAGALVSARMGRRRTTALEIALSQYHKSNGSPDSVKMLIKYYFLQNPDCNIDNFILDYQHCQIISSFAPKCARELQEMETSSVGCGLTLRQWLPQVAIEDRLPKVENYDFGQLLKAIKEKRFVEYFGAIASKVETSRMKENLEKCEVYAEENCPDLLSEKAILPYDCVIKLANYLHKEDLLGLILVFYNFEDNEHATEEEQQNSGQSETISQNRPRSTGE